VWLKVETFHSKREADAYVACENCWSYHYTNNTADGTKVYYRCNTVKCRGAQCPRSIYVLYHCDSSLVTVFRTDNDHDHSDSVESGKHGLSSDVKTVIIQLFDDGVQKPNLVLAALRSRGIAEPPKVQLKNFLQSHRKKKFGSPTIKMSELKTS
jgi:hypothetical protein